MIHIPWKDRYNINYKEIDDQHKGLVELLNELADLGSRVSQGDEVASVFHRLCQYALVHFATEERYMAAAGYPGLARQQDEHAAFIRDLLQLNQSYEPGDPALAEAAFHFVRDWYLTHIMHSDMDYGPCLKSYHSRAKIQGIVFDLSGVVCEVDETRFLQSAAPLFAMESGPFKEMIDRQPSLFQGYELGFIGTSEFLADLSNLCGQPLPEAEFVQAYALVFSPNEPVLDLARQLKPRYKLGLIADTTPLRYEHGLDPEVLALFDAVTLPCKLKAGKPDPAVFKDILAKLDLVAEECAYVDDQPAFALAATGQLLHGVAGSRADTLQAGLRRLKVDI